MTINLADPAFYADPHDVYRTWRDETPVRWDENANVWAVSRHADVMAVSRDPNTFCNGKGVLLTDRARGVVATNSVLYLDPPDHQQHRKLVNPGFHPHRLVDLEPRVRELAAGIVSGLPEGEAFDFVEEVAVPFPLLVISDLLGIPGDDRDAFDDGRSAGKLGSIRVRADRALSPAQDESAGPGDRFRGQSPCRFAGEFYFSAGR